jgi:hypothetical protein
MSIVLQPSLAQPCAPHVRSLIPNNLPALPLNQGQVACLAAFRQGLAQGEMIMGEVPCLSGTTAADGRLIACQDRYGLPLRTYLCPRTGLMWVSPSFDRESVAVFYSRYYRWMYTGSPTPDADFAPKQEKHGREILSYVGPEISKGLVFDVGCGAGATVLPFVASGWTAGGCDFGAEYIEIGRRLGLALGVGDHNVLRSSAPCDLLMACHVLEHTLNPVEELLGWSSLIKDGGYMYVEVPGLFRAYDDYKTLDRFLHIAHTYHFTLDSLRALLAPLGFEIVKGDESVRALFRKTGRPITSPDNSRLAGRILSFLDRQEAPAGRLLRRVRRPLHKALLSAKRRVQA